MSMWIGFHDDMVEPGSPDPVKRQSTRILAVGLEAAHLGVDEYYDFLNMGVKLTAMPVRITRLPWWEKK